MLCLVLYKWTAETRHTFLDLLTLRKDIEPAEVLSIQSEEAGIEYRWNNARQAVDCCQTFEEGYKMREASVVSVVRAAADATVNI